MHRSYSWVQTHAHRTAGCTRPNEASSPQKRMKRGNKTQTSGSAMRVDEINPARMKGGEHPDEAGTAHGENYKKKNI